MADYQGKYTGVEVDALLDYTKDKKTAEYQSEADGKYSVATSASGQTYVADQADSTTMTVSVVVKFNNVAVTPSNAASKFKDTDGWSNPNTGEYTKSITASVSDNDKSIAAVSDIKYTPQSGKYVGIEVKKSSTSKTIGVQYPIFYGFINESATVPSANSTVNIAQGAAAALTREVVTEETTIANASALNNGTANDAKYWILTHGSASGTDTMTGTAMFESPISVSVLSNTRTMTGYKLYVSKKSALAGGDLSSSCTVKINP